AFLRAVAEESLLLFKLDVDDVVRLAGLRSLIGRRSAVAAGRGRASGRAGSSRGRVQVLGHRLTGALKILDRAIDGRRVVTLLGLVDAFDGRPNSRLVRVGQFVLVLFQELLELIDALVGGVARLGEIALTLVLGGVRLGVALHPIDLVLRQTAGRLDR